MSSWFRVPWMVWGDSGSAPEAGVFPPPGAAQCTLAEALLRPARTLPLAQAVGHAAAEYVWAYPPGVPLLAPGGTVTPGFAAAVAALADAGTALRHSGGSAPDALRVLA